MFKYGCRDVGVDCDYVLTGAAFEEVKEKVFAHAGVAHAEMLKGMTAFAFSEDDAVAPIRVIND